MLYRGPWRDEIVPFDEITKSAFERFLDRVHADFGEIDLPFVPLPSLGKCEDPISHDCRLEGLGIQIEGVILAAVIYSVAQNIRSDGRRLLVMRLAAYVLPEHRRKGMATALLVRCMAIGNDGNVRHLVLDGLEADEGTRGLARNLGAELIFVGSDCQAWIELAAPVATQHNSTAFTSFHERDETPAEKSMLFNKRKAFPDMNVFAPKSTH